MKTLLIYWWWFYLRRKRFSSRDVLLWQEELRTADGGSFSLDRSYDLPPNSFQEFPVPVPYLIHTGSSSSSVRQISWFLFRIVDDKSVRTTRTRHIVFWEKEHQHEEQSHHLDFMRSLFWECVNVRRCYYDPWWICGARLILVIQIYPSRARACDFI